MKVKKVCVICGAEFIVPHWREETAKCCSKKCLGVFFRGKPNVECAICGKPFHRKESHLKRFKGELGFCCSKECLKEQMRIRMTGEGNHQHGLKGPLNTSFKNGNLFYTNHNLKETMVYVGDWYKKSMRSRGRVYEHRYLVEKNHTLFPENCFEEIDGWFYLKDGYAVHHIDFNHSNNSLDNLKVLTKAEHTALHNKINIRQRNSKGQFISATV